MKNIFLQKKIFGLIDCNSKNLSIQRYYRVYKRIEHIFMKKFVIHWSNLNLILESVMLLFCRRRQETPAEWEIKMTEKYLQIVPMIVVRL